MTPGPFASHRTSSPCRPPRGAERRRAPLVWAGLVLCALGGVVACSGKGAARAGGEKGLRDTKIRTESCSKSNGFDTNRDGKKDLFEAAAGGKLACRASDLDFDGTVDQTTFFDGNGVVRRREVDLDGNGVPNVIETFQGGKLVLRASDTAGLGKLDMWDTYNPATGERTARERDTNGDGHIDQFWVYAGTRITVRFDRNEDGVPDEEGMLVWGDGFETAPQADAGAGDAGAAPAQAASDAGSDKPVAAPEGALTDAGTKPRDGGAK